MRFQTQLVAPDARLYYPLSQFLPISSVFGTALLGLTTIWISYGSFNAPQYTRPNQFLAIIAVFDAVLLGFTTVQISSEPFNAPLYRSWSSFWRVRLSWRGSTLGLTPPIHPPEPVLAHHHCA